MLNNSFGLTNKNNGDSNILKVSYWLIAVSIIGLFLWSWEELYETSNRDFLTLQGKEYTER